MFLVREGARPNFSPPPDDDDALLEEVRRDRAQRAPSAPAPEAIQGKGEES
jgi:hypothetical protein